MGKIKVKLLWILLPIALIFKFGCVDLPKDIVMPKWDVDLNVPIVNRNYTLWDAIKKDTSKLRYYRDQDKFGLLYYSDLKRIDPVTVGDNLNISSFTTSTSLQIGPIEITNPEPVTATMANIDFGLNNGTGPFPAKTNISLTQNYNASQQFLSVKVGTGTLEFKVKNNFPDPVQIIIHRIIIRNKEGAALLVDDNFDNMSYVLSPDSTYKMNYSLAGKTVKNQLNIQIMMSTYGSGMRQVTLTDFTNLSFSAQLKDFVLDEVKAVIPQNNFTISDSYEFDDSTYVQTATIDRGTLKITANSNIDIPLTATLTIPSLKNSAGNPYTQVISFGRKEKNKVVPTLSLAGYTLSDPQGGLVNTIQYSVTGVSVVDNLESTITKTDDISATIEISDLYFRSFTGKLKPTNVAVNETTIDLNLGDVQNNLLVNQIDFENPKIELKLKKSTDVKLAFSGQLIGRNNVQTAQLNIPYTVIESGETTITLNSTDVRNFIKSFIGKLPQTISVKGKGIINPLNTDLAVHTIRSTDSLSGSASLQFPMKVSITGGSFRDSSSVEIDQDQRDEMKKVSSGSLNLEVQNGIAFDAGFSARLYDENNNFLMNLPPNRAPNDTLVHIQAATVNTQGKVTGAVQSKITFALNSEEITKITQSKYMISKITFYTTGNNSVPVEFKTSDAISIKAYGSLKYTVEEKK